MAKQTLTITTIAGITPKPKSQTIQQKKAAYQNIKQYANGQQVYEDDEYEYVVVRKPRNAAQDVPQPVTRRADDYTIDIDPSFFEQTFTMIYWGMS